jgi:outer membrane lipoprotein carrier protein
MNKSAILITLLILSGVVAVGQNDPQANQILDSFSSKASKAPSVSMEFTMITNDLAERTADTVKGALILNKDKYKLTLGDNITWFDGENTWNYLSAENEVTITKTGKKDHSFQSHPSEIFTMYKSDFKSKLIEENAGIYIVDLYPSDMKSDLVRVRLNIRKNDLNLIAFEYKRRDGIDINIIINRYDLSQRPDQKYFTFPADTYKGVEVNDMR